MTKVEDYISGKILEDTNAMLKAIKAVELPLNKIEKFEPMQIDNC